MAIRNVLSIPHPTLYKVSEKVTTFNDELRTLARDMFDTMYNEQGVGLAAVQIGILKRMLVIDLVDAGFTKGIFINPILLDSSKEMQNDEEGCLSVPGISSLLSRPMWVKVQYQTLSGDTKIIEGEKIMARALLHEMDHLDGKVFVDLLEPSNRQLVECDIQNLIDGKPLQNPKTPKYRRNAELS